ncbi:MAG: hypothetical protein QOE70_4099 [Chthoniobacter sp.]|jgi:hypothetical protein|nr:hypothetical protein [Chthoniobacter sp.]
MLRIAGLGRKEMFNIPRIGEEPPPAEGHLAAMTEDCLPFCFALGFGERNTQARRGQPATARVNDIVEKARPRSWMEALQRQKDQDTQGIMIGMHIVPGRRHDERGAPPGNRLEACSLGVLIGTQEQVGGALIWKLEKLGLLSPQSQSSHCRKRFVAPLRAPSRPVAFSNPPTPLEQPLRPGIVLSVGDENHAHLGATLNGPLQQPAGPERLIIGMGGNDHYPILRSE